MKVKQLIELLQTMPPDADVWHLWDGEPRTEIQMAWVTRDGAVITADYDAVCYSPENRPIDAPDDRYFSTPCRPPSSPELEKAAD
jgi:hypothetical protein